MPSLVGIQDKVVGAGRGVGQGRGVGNREVGSPAVRQIPAGGVTQCSEYSVSSQSTGSRGLVPR